MSTRIVRLDAICWNGNDIEVAMDAAPDEATLPTVYRCECGFVSDVKPQEGADHRDRREQQAFYGGWHIGSFTAIPLPVHLGVEVTP